MFVYLEREKTKKSEEGRRGGGGNEGTHPVKSNKLLAAPDHLQCIDGTHSGDP